MATTVRLERFPALSAGGLAGRRFASEVIREVGGSEVVAATMRQLCEDAVDDDDFASILLDGPSVADLLLDSSDILSADSSMMSDSMFIQPSGDGEKGDESETVFYPAMEAATSSVITLQMRVSAGGGGKKSSIDSFLTNLSAAYKGAKREENSAIKLRISLIAEQGKGPQVQALEFRYERDYWGFVSAVSRAVVVKENVHWTGGCELPSSSSGAAAESTSVSGAAKQKILSIFSGTKAKQEVDTDRLEIHGMVLTVTSHGSVAYTLDLNTLRALALMSDWVEPKPYILEIRIASEADPNNRGLGGTRLALMGTNLEPVTSAQYYRRVQDAAQHIGAGINENILLPLTLDEVAQSKSVNGLTSVAVLTGTKYNATSSHPAGIHTIPFQSFLIQDKARPRRASIVSYTKPTIGASGASSPPQLRLNESVVATVPITQEVPRRAARVLIKGSTDIPSSRLGHPSAYCAVYLVDDKNNKINDANGSVIEVKTEVVKGNNPTWNKDLTIEMPSTDGSSDTVAGVMVMVKDAGGGLLKPLHLGQVVVPIGCFIENHEAQLCLPLEPTARMPKNVLTLGEIHIVTQLCTGGLAPSPISSPTGVRKRTSSASVPPAGQASVPVSYTLRPSFALGVSWPFRVLSTGAGEINTGHLACGQTALRLVLSPGHGGILASCQEARAGTLVLDWSQVFGVVAITEASLMLTVRVRRTFPSNGGKISVSGKITPQTSPVSHPAELELLVAPCPSRKLQEALLDRLSLAKVRADLKQLVNMRKSGAGGSSGGATGGGGSGGAGGSAATSRQRQMSIVGPASSMQHAATDIDANKLVPVASLILDKLQTVVDDALEGINGAGVHETGPVVEVDAFGYALSPKGELRSLAPCAVTPEMRRFANIRKFARARLYQALLMHVCKSLNKGPVYTLDGVRAVVDADVKRLAAGGAPLSASDLASQLHERHAKLTEAAVSQITDYILCSAEHWRAASHSLTYDPEASRDLVQSRAAECLCEVIRGYHAQLRGLLASYTSSADAFKRTPGQEAKMSILKLVMYRDEEFDAAIQKRLVVLGVRANPPLSLIGPRFTIHDLVGWYQSSLVVETQMWLSKTVDREVKNKLNEFNLPWDIDEVGDRVISALPETLQKQMSVYLSLCEDSGNAEHPAAGNAAAVAKAEEIRGMLQTIREKIVEAVAKCMLLLSDEYRRALQSKHWERKSRAGDDVEQNFKFLISVANDCLRVSNFQVDAQLSSPGGVGSSDVHTAVVVAFMGTADIAIKYLIRIIFSEAFALLADFDEYWTIPEEKATKTLIDVMTSYFAHLRPKLDERFVDKLLVCCAGVVATRMLLMLRDRGSRGKKFSADDIKRYRFDVQQLRNCFQAELPNRDPATVKPLAVLQDTSDLLCKPLGEIRLLMKTVAKDHVVAGIGAPAGASSSSSSSSSAPATSTPPIRAGALMLQCLALQLRPDVTPELDAAVRGAVEEAAKVPLSWHPFAQDAMEQSVVQRVFGGQGLAGVGGEGGAGADRDKDKGALKQLREKATNAFLGKKKRKMEEEDVRILRMLGLELDLIDEAEHLKERGGAGGGHAADDDIDERSSVAGSIMGLGASIAHIDEADLVIVNVKKIEVQGLTSNSLFGSVNPYIAMTLGETRLKTQVAWNSASGKASWDVPMSFRYSRARLASGQARLRVEIFDKERLRRKRALGSVNIKLAGLELFRIESWFALEGGEGIKTQTGEIFAIVDLARRDDP